MAVYTYTISTDTFDGTSNLTKLRGEVGAGSFGSQVTYVKYEDLTDPMGTPLYLEIAANPDLTSGEKLELDAIVAAHTGADAETVAGEDYKKYGQTADYDGNSIVNVSEINGANFDSLVQQLSILGQTYSAEVDAEAGTTSEVFSTRASINENFEAGTYLIWWSAELRGDAGPNRISQARLQNTTTAETYGTTATAAFLLDVTFLISLLTTFRSVRTSNGGIKVVTLSGTNEIALQWRRDSGLLGTAYIQNARIFIQRIA